MRCILVDDEIHAVDTMTRLLIGKVNIKLTSLVNNPFAILEEAKSQRDIDVAIIDICMEGVDGIELARQLIEIRHDVKIILITGYGKDETIKRAKEQLGDNLHKILNKPYSSKAMLSALNELSSEVIETKKEVKIVTKGGFDLFLSGKLIEFTCKKSKELLALIVDARGVSVPRDKSIGCIWPDSKLKSSGKSYDHAKQELAKILKKYNIEDILQYQRGSISLDVSKVDIDFVAVLKQGKKLDKEKYMQCYEWAR